jgi:hypothetical protein
MLILIGVGHLLFLAHSMSCTLCCIRYGLTEYCAKSDNGHVDILRWKPQ